MSKRNGAGFLKIVLLSDPIARSVKNRDNVEAVITSFNAGLVGSGRITQSTDARGQMTQREQLDIFSFTQPGDVSWIWKKGMTAEVEIIGFHTRIAADKQGLQQAYLNVDIGEIRPTGASLPQMFQNIFAASTPQQQDETSSGQEDYYVAVEQPAAPPAPPQPPPQPQYRTAAPPAPPARPAVPSSRPSATPPAPRPSAPPARRVATPPSRPSAPQQDLPLEPQQEDPIAL